eukprot:UN26703
MSIEEPCDRISSTNLTERQQVKLAIQQSLTAVNNANRNHQKADKTKSKINKNLKNNENKKVQNQIVDKTSVT